MIVKSFSIDETEIIVYDDFIIKDKAEIEYRQQEINSLAVKIVNKINKKTRRYVEQTPYLRCFFVFSSPTTHGPTNWRTLK